MKAFLLFILACSLPAFSVAQEGQKQMQSISISLNAAQADLDCKEPFKGQGFTFCNFRFQLQIETNLPDSMKVSGHCFVKAHYGISAFSGSVEERKVSFDMQNVRGYGFQIYNLRFDFKSGQVFHVKIPSVSCDITNYSLND